MFNETLKNLPADIAIFSAAVADWKVKNLEKNKIKKKDKLNLNLEKNIDILKHISNHNSLRPKIVIGFAAETNNLANNSKKKLLEKNCDWLISNDVSDPKIGFNSDYNEVTIFYKNKNQEKISKIKKSLLADKIVERVISQLN
jgi:Phosphopantothenoylcysteine synthetase/decarboxylase